MRKKQEKKYIMLGGERFLFNEKNNINIFNASINNYMFNLKSIYQCYDRPSQTKVYIFNKWYDILKSDTNYDILDYGIISYNCNFIILGAFIKSNIDNKYYFVDIRPSGNNTIERVVC